MGCPKCLWSEEADGGDAGGTGREVIGSVGFGDASKSEDWDGCRGGASLAEKIESGAGGDELIADSFLEDGTEENQVRGSCGIRRKTEFVFRAQASGSNHLGDCVAGETDGGREQPSG